MRGRRDALVDLRYVAGPAAALADEALGLRAVEVVEVGRPADAQCARSSALGGEARGGAGLLDPVVDEGDVDVGPVRLAFRRRRHAEEEVGLVRVRLEVADGK